MPDMPRQAGGVVQQASQRARRIYVTEFRAMTEGTGTGGSRTSTSVSVHAQYSAYFIASVQLEDTCKGTDATCKGDCSQGAETASRFASSSASVIMCDSVMVARPRSALGECNAHRGSRYACRLGGSFHTNTAGSSRHRPWCRRWPRCRATHFRRHEPLRASRLQEQQTAAADVCKHCGSANQTTAVAEAKGQARMQQTWAAF